MIDKKTILEFLKKNELCVLATASKKGKPEAAVMAYAIKDDFSLLLHTDQETRKYKNLKENNQVAVVVGGFKEDPTVQIDGVIKELEGAEEKKAKDLIFSLHPEWKEYFSSPTGRFLEVKPIWLRYSDFSKEPPEIMEIRKF